MKDEIRRLLLEYKEFCEEEGIKPCSRCPFSSDQRSFLKPEDEEKCISYCGYLFPGWGDFITNENGRVRTITIKSSGTNNDHTYLGCPCSFGEEFVSRRIEHFLKHNE